MKDTFSPPARPRSLRRRVTRALLAAAMFVMTMAFTARPAEAASWVKGCFQVKTGGLYYNNTFTQQGLTTWLMYSADGVNWIPFTSTLLDQNGCAAWYVSGTLRSYELRIFVYSTGGQGGAHGVVGATYSGWSPFKAPRGDRQYHLGSGYVSCDRCSWG